MDNDVNQCRMGESWMWGIWGHLHQKSNFQPPFSTPRLNGGEYPPFSILNPCYQRSAQWMCFETQFLASRRAGLGDWIRYHHPMPPFPWSATACAPGFGLYGGLSTLPCHWPHNPIHSPQHSPNNVHLGGQLQQTNTISPPFRGFEI